MNGMSRSDARKRMENTMGKRPIEAGKYPASTEATRPHAELRDDQRSGIDLLTLATACRGTGDYGGGLLPLDADPGTGQST